MSEQIKRSRARRIKTQSGIGRGQPGWINPSRGPLKPKHPLTRELFEELQRQGWSVAEVEKKLLYSRGLMNKWASGELGMRLVSFVDMANFLGYDVKLVRRDAAEEK